MSDAQLIRLLHGLERVCKLYGKVKCGDVMMAWDYKIETETENEN